MLSCQNKRYITDSNNKDYNLSIVCGQVVVWNNSCFWYDELKLQSCIKIRLQFWKKLYLSLLNLSLSVSNTCLMLRFRAWAVYQSCSFWKLGSCVSPMMSRGACCAPLWLTSLAEWGRAGQKESFWRASRPDLDLPLLQMTHSIHATPPQGNSAGERHQYSNTVLFVAGYSNVTLIKSLVDVGNAENIIYSKILIQKY